MYSPFEVPEGCAVTGVVLADQLKGVDWQARGAQRAGPVPTEVIGDLLAKLAPLLGFR